LQGHILTVISSFSTCDCSSLLFPTPGRH